MDQVVTVGTALPHPVLMTDKACAAYLDVSLSTWWRLVRAGKAPTAVKLGRLTRWRVVDLQAYVSGLGAS